MSTTSSPPQPASDGFWQDFGTCARDLREGLVEGLAALGGPLEGPQDLARRLRVDKMLAWKISKIVASEEPHLWASHVPGLAGLGKVVRALEERGVAAATTARIQESGAAFEQMVDRHVGDRSTLHAVLSGRHPASQSALLLDSRRLAFRGNSGMLGVQADVQLTTFVLAPNADDPSLADMVQVGGLIGLRRLRSDVSWPLFHRAQWTRAGGSDVLGEPLVPEACGGDGMPWLPEHCSRPLPEVDVVNVGQGLQYVLAPGPIGLTAAVSCAYGFVVRRAGPAHRSADETRSEFGCNLLTPARRLQLDLFVDDALGWTVTEDYALISRMHGDWSTGASKAPANTIPASETTLQLGQGLTGVSTPHVPRYRDLMGTVFERTGWEAGRFRGWRLSLEVPPIPATALLRCTLADRST